MDQDKPSLFDRFNNWVKRSVMLKLLTTGILILILLIPSSMVSDLIRERQLLRNDAEEEISGKWGGEQTLGALVLSVPYDVTVKNDKGELVTQTEYAHFLPDELEISGKINPEKRYRGIYVVMLYNAKLQMKGKFNPLNISALHVDPKLFHFDAAFFSLGITDMRGINENIPLTINEGKTNFEPGILSHDIFSSGVSVPFNLHPDSSYHFSFNLDLNGSKQINFLPLGKENDVKLSSSWPNPSFDGNFLPDKRTIDANGFEASWKVLQLNRNYPQQALGALSPNSDYSSFGVKLLLPIDEYQKTNRSNKYSIMFIILTFTTFFFTEIISKKRIHPLQYLLVGFAIVLFYVLLLSFSEHIKFDSAYWIACLAIMTLITYYVWNMLRNIKLTAVVSGVFLILYAFFYSLLQLEDYALLFGSIGLLIILAVVMHLTRKINWYGDEE